MQKIKKLRFWLSVLVLGLVVGFGLQFVRAWVEPTTTPPTQNISAPITTKGDQVKDGSLTVKSIKLGNGQYFTTMGFFSGSFGAIACPCDTDPNTLNCASSFIAPSDLAPYSTSGGPRCNDQYGLSSYIRYRITTDSREITPDKASLGDIEAKKISADSLNVNRWNTRLFRFDIGKGTYYDGTRGYSYYPNKNTADAVCRQNGYLFATDYDGDSDCCGWCISFEGLNTDGTENWKKWHCGDGGDSHWITNVTCLK